LIGNFKQVAVDQTSMRRRSFDLRQALDEVLSTLQPKLKHTRHRLEVDVERGIVLDSFPGPLAQIVTNLVTNSLMHAFEGIEAGVIRIEAAPTGDDRIALSYADNGAGIPEALVKRVFDPFFTTKLGGGGSGLGLYIVFNLVTGVLGGTIALSSSLGQGARFDMLLPRVAPQTPTTGEENYAA
jgi:signal transduction histidine kinase